MELPQHTGIQNIANNCYFNAILQSLASSKSIYSILNNNYNMDKVILFIINKYKLNDLGLTNLQSKCTELLITLRTALQASTSSSITSSIQTEIFVIEKILKYTYETYIYLEWKNVVKKLHDNINKTVDIANLLGLLYGKTKTTPFAHLFNGGQNDPHECLLYLFDVFHHYSSCPLSKYNKPIPIINFNNINIKINNLGNNGNNINTNINNDLNMVEIEKIYRIQFIKEYENEYSEFITHFYNTYLTIIKCNKCNHTNYNISPLSIIDVPLDTSIYRNGHLFNHDRDGSHSINIVDCLRQFLKTELLEGYSCDNCKLQNTSFISKRLLSVANTIIIEIKKFTVLPNTIVKNNINIKYPMILDMSIFGDHLGGKYELFSVVNHQGAMNFGHYYSFNKLLNTNTWLYCNDENVKIINNIDQMTSDGNAYLLFYQLIM